MMLESNMYEDKTIKKNVEREKSRKSAYESKISAATQNFCKKMAKFEFDAVMSMIDEKN